MLINNCFSVITVVLALKCGSHPGNLLPQLSAWAPGSLPLPAQQLQLWVGSAGIAPQQLLPGALTAYQQ